MSNSNPTNVFAPLVSVIMPTYQRADLIAESIDSCYAQTYQNFELVVIDDGSTDNTETIVKQYDHRTRYIKLGGNSGPAKARNEGVQRACGDFVAMLDSDDLWSPTKLEKQVALLNAQPEVGWVYCNLKFFGCAYAEQRHDYFLTRKPSRGMMLKNILCGAHPMMTPTIIVRRKNFLEIGGYDETLRIAEDADLYNRLAHRYPADYVDEVLVFVRRHTEKEFQGTGYSSEVHLSVMERVLKYEPSVYSQMTRAEIDKSFVTLCRQSALKYRYEGSRLKSLNLLYRAWRYNPLNLNVYRDMLAVLVKG